MTLIAVVLLSISALAHAYWNLRGKSRQPSAAMFLIGDGTVAVLLLPVLIFSLPVLVKMPGRIWIFAAASGLCEAMYYTGLAGAYRQGNLSVVYPVVRSLPIVLVAAISFMLGRSGHIGTASLAGMAVIVAGCMALPMGGRISFRWRAGHFWAMLAGIASAGYMLIDDGALRELRPAVQGPAASAIAAIRFAPLVALFTSLWLAILVVWRESERKAFALIRKTGFAYAQKTGLVVWLSYGLVMVAMGYARDVSYVTAFRQISIPIGAVLGVMILREPMPWPKVVGVAMVFVGVVVVALG